MAPTFSLGLEPDDVTEGRLIPLAVRAGHNALDDIPLAVYGLLPDERAPAVAFVAKTPEDALRWLCRRLSKPRIIKAVRHLYDYPDSLQVDDNTNPLELGIEEGEETGPGAAENNRLEEGSRGQKRRRAGKEKTSRQVNRDLVKKVNQALVQTVASTQDWEVAKAPDALSNEDLKYRTFATKLPGAGLNTVTSMINKAVSVGTEEALRDWQAILSIWTRQDHYQKQLSEPVALRTQLRLEDVHPSQETQDLPDEDFDGITMGESAQFCRLFFEAKKNHVDGIAGEMRHRWKMDLLYEEYDRLWKLMKRRGGGSDGRGRRYDVLAKERLFATVYDNKLGIQPTKDSHPDEWRSFGQFLDWGKRWNMIKKRFDSPGIFALLPRTMVPNAFIEKTLNQTRVSQWIEMLAECNTPVADMAFLIEPLFLACMQEESPPQQFRFLESLPDTLPDSPLALLQAASTVSQSQQQRLLGVRNRVQSVQDSEDEDTYEQ